MNRPLSTQEQVLWKLDQASSQNFVMIARISGMPGEITDFEPALRQGLDMVQQKHPPLKCKFKEGTPPGFIYEDVPPIPLRIIERTGDDHWVEVAENEMKEPMPWTNGPLVRVVLLASGDNCDLLASFCHVAADAASAITFAKNLLPVVDALLRGKKLTPEAPLSPLPPLTDLLKKDLEFEDDLQDTTIGKTGETHEPKVFIGDKAVSPETRITRVIQKILDREKATKFTALCKKENTSVHGAICAALLQAVVEKIRDSQGVPKNGPLKIACMTPVNIRHQFAEPVGEGMGNFISDAIHFQPIDESSSLWEAAREVKKALQRELKLGNDIKGIYGIDEFFGKFNTPPDVFIALNELLPPFVITNIGKLDIPEQFGQLVLENLHFTAAVNPGAPAGLGIAVTSFRGEITLNFLYLEPLLSYQTANSVIDSIMKRLQEALV